MAPLDAPRGASNKPVDQMAVLDLELQEIISGRCTEKQKAWLRELPEHDYQMWGSWIEVSKATVHDWLKQPHILRAREIQDEIDALIATKARLTRRFVLRTYEAIAYADILDYYTDDTFTQLVPKALWTQEMRIACKKISFDRFGRPAIELYSRMDVADRTAKIHGMLTDKVDVNVHTEAKTNADDLSDAELAAIASAGSPAPPQPSTRTLQ